jgi:hypothetical protein
MRTLSWCSDGGRSSRSFLFLLQLPFTAFSLPVLLFLFESLYFILLLLPSLPRFSFPFHFPYGLQFLLCPLLLLLLLDRRHDSLGNVVWIGAEERTACFGSLFFCRSRAQFDVDQWRWRRTRPVKMNIQGIHPWLGLGASSWCGRSVSIRAWHL